MLRNLNHIFFVSLIVLTFSLYQTSNAAVFNIDPGDTAALIAAINTANTNNQADTINLGGGTYNLTSGPFAVDGDNGLPSILFDMGNPLTINGNGSTIQRDPSIDPDGMCDGDGSGTEFRIFHISASGVLTLNDITVSNGCASGINPSSFGGGIFNRGTLEINNSTISGNEAVDGGGGITNRGTLEINNSTISGNTAGVAAVVGRAALRTALGLRPQAR